MKLYKLYILKYFFLIISFKNIFIDAQAAIGFPGFGEPSNTTPRPRPTRPSSSDKPCDFGETCLFIGRCPAILQLARENTDIIRHTHCGFDENRRFKVCCPSSNGTPTPTRRPVTPPRPRPTPRPNGGTGIFFPGSGNNTPRPTTARPTPGGSGLLPEPPQCGVQSTEDRIFGGRPAPIGAYPWVAALGYTTQSSSTITYECAGTVINERYVLTAGHCLDPAELGGRVLRRLNIGDWDLTSPADCQAGFGGRPRCFGPHIEAGIEDTIVHPQYNKRGRNSDDIALIRLDITLDFLASNQAPIAPICLPHQGMDAVALAAGRSSIAVGWGFTEHGNRSNILLRVALPFADQQICRNRYGARWVGKQMCVGGKSGFDTCSGDSGGPLILSGPTGPPYLLIGIVSFGPLPCALPDTPAVYTEVSRYRTWIESNMRP